MKILLLVVLPLMLFAAPDSTEKIEVSILGAVMRPGKKIVASGEPLQNVLNAAVCTEASSFKLIRVNRIVDGKAVILKLGLRDAKTGKDQEEFKLKDGDIVIVPLRTWSPEGEKRIRWFEGGFYLDSEKDLRNATEKEGDGK